MVKFVCLLLCLSALVISGYAENLKCYRCSSDKEDGCTKHAKLESQTCGNPTPNFKNVCYYKYSEDKDKKIAVNSSCALVQQNAPLTQASVVECNVTPGGKVNECRVCDSNLCNSAPVLQAVFGLASLPLMYLITRLLVH